MIDKTLSFVYKKIFPLMQKVGVNLTPNSYISPIPNLPDLDDEKVWVNPSELIGIEMNDSSMIDLLSYFKKFKIEYDKFPKTKTSIEHQYYLNNNAFVAVDAEIYYSMIRYFKPNKIVEIGSGFSTYLAAQAVLKNKEEYGIECELIAIEPYPNEILRKGFPGLSKLIISRLEDVDMSIFNELHDNDILFIDSSHALKIGGDVQYEYLEILPRLNRGVIVHIHDIFLPLEYPKEWILNEFVFWNEQYILQAFLAFNESFEIIWGSSYMHLNYSYLLKNSFESYNSQKDIGPGSFWIKRMK